MERDIEMCCEKDSLRQAGLQLESAYSPGCRLPLKDGKDQKIDSPLESPKWHSDLQNMLVLDLRSQNNKKNKSEVF